MKKLKLKKVKKVVDEYPSDAELDKEARRYQECEEFLRKIAGVVKALPCIYFDQLKGMFKVGDLELSVALLCLTNNGTLHKGRFGYFHRDQFSKK